jgi:hypothetical protein
MPLVVLVRRHCWELIWYIGNGEKWFYQGLSGSNVDTAKYRRLSFIIVNLCTCSSKRLLYKLRLRTFCKDFLEKLERSLLIIVCVNKDWILSHNLSESFSKSSRTVFSFRKKSTNPKDERYLLNNFKHNT